MAGGEIGAGEVGPAAVVLAGVGLVGGGLSGIERAVGAAVRVANELPAAVFAFVMALPGTPSGVG